MSDGNDDEFRRLLEINCRTLEELNNYVRAWDIDPNNVLIRNRHEQLQLQVNSL